MQITSEFIEKVEEEYLKILIDLLQKGDIDKQTAKQYTHEFLEMTPFANAEDMDAKIQKFTENHPEFGGLYINLLQYEEEARTDAVINRMRSHIKENRVDDALKLVQNK